MPIEYFLHNTGADKRRCRPRLGGYDPIVWTQQGKVTKSWLVSDCGRRSDENDNHSSNTFHYSGLKMAVEIILIRSHSLS